ncbi:hypothetical protein [Photobacterium leiognathi]|uniref:hypothetical protein n=1 Tax=Photobacterium leiognathi TaxID=553611 RepID=UPI002738E311|nr:hypothetical protein [Photobacterium leiognathi]
MANFLLLVLVITVVITFGSSLARLAAARMGQQHGNHVDFMTAYYRGGGAALFTAAMEAGWCDPICGFDAAL